MNQANILRVAQNFLAGIDEIEDNVYRGELKIVNQAVAGICYIDFNRKESFEDFSRFQEKLLADDYYEHPGSLQWNYYLFILQDTVSYQTKSQIEKDDKFARKYVFTEDQFTDFFKLESSGPELTGNIIQDWKRELDAVALHEVYSRASYVSSVDNFMNNTAPPIAVDLNLPAYQVDKIDFINQIKLTDSYRSFPKSNEPFKFGKVNLIKGINGVGKTSMLEGIELIVCGKTFRNPGKKYPANCVEGYFNHRPLQTEYCTPLNIEKYRSRDVAWYHNNSKSNELANSFNRFNFFNTDAANEFAISSDEEGIKGALFKLVMGPEYDYMFERIQGFHQRIKPLYKNLSVKFEEAEEKVRETGARITALKKNDSIETLRNVLKENLKELQFINLEYASDRDLVQIELRCNELSASIEQLNSPNVSPIQTKLQLEVARTSLTAKKSTFDRFVADLDKITPEIIRQQAIVQEREKQLIALDKALKYFTNIRSFELEGLADRLRIATSKIQNLQAVRNALGIIDLQIYVFSGKLEDYIAQKNSQLSESRERLRVTVASIHSLRSTFDKIGQLVSQIRTAGKQWVILDEDAASCPLCKADYKREELLQLLSREVDDGNILHSQLLPLTDLQSELSNQIEEYSSNLKAVTSLTSAYRIFSKVDPGTLSLEVIVKSIQNFLAEEAAVIQSSNEGNNLLSTMQSLSLSERELGLTRAEIDQLFEGRLSFVPGNPDDFLEAKKDIEQKNADSRKAIDDLMESRSGLALQLKKDLDVPTDQAYRQAEIAELLSSEEARLNRFLEIFERIAKIVTLDNDSDIRNIGLQLSVLEKNIATYKSDLQNQIELKTAVLENQKYDDFIKQNLANYQRVEKGYQLLSRLIEENGSDQLKDFFDHNMEEICDIFRTMHTPQEFSSINYKDSQLYLITQTGEERMITEISTGQRAALALSVFISMNRKLKKGPNIILFDDPVSHIDDFNALSFLDFLRFFILKEGKQIFFATANARLAELISKKFNFLGDDFVTFDLKR